MEMAVLFFFRKNT